MVVCHYFAAEFTTHAVKITQAVIQPFTGLGHIAIYPLNCNMIKLDVGEAWGMVSLAHSNTAAACKLVLPSGPSTVTPAQDMEWQPD